MNTLFIPKSSTLFLSCLIAAVKSIIINGSPIPDGFAGSPVIETACFPELIVGGGPILTLTNEEKTNGIECRAERRNYREVWPG